MVKTTVTAQGKKILYRTIGRSKKLPLVLLHGFCEDSLVWNTILPFLKNNRILCIDLPGFGGSDCMQEAALDAYAEAVRAVLVFEKIDRCIILGHSMGGYVALAFAQKHPEYLAGFGLVHSHPFADDAEKKQARERSIRLLENGKKKAYLKMLFPSLFEPNFIENNPQILALLKRRAHRFPTQGIIDALIAMKNRTDNSRVLRNANLPAFYFLGEKDLLLPHFSQNDMLEMPNILDVHLQAEVAHMGMFECPEILGAAIAKFHTFVLHSK